MKLTLLRRYQLAGNAWAYEFEPERPLSWIAGQFVKVEVPHDHPDDEGSQRQFTISAAPHEGLIRISTRLTNSTFKQALHRVEKGQSIKLIDHPAGDFVWHERPTPHILVAQGIGITPFFAMLSDRAHHALPLTAELYWTNRTPDIPFLDQITAWQKLGLQVTLSDEPFKAPKLAELIPDLSSRNIYVSSPKSLIQLLSPPYSVPAGHLKQDVFPNYPAAAY
jgi:ferredoxin-NADP reductase